MKLQQTIRNSVTFEMARKAILQGVFIVSIFACFLPNEAHAQITFPLHVTTTSDAVVAGACVAGMINPGCSLRGAIQAADGTPSLDIIYFNIPASDPTCSAGVCTINLTQSLPEIHTGMVISGPGADKLTVKAATGVQIRIFTGGVAAPGEVTV